MWQRINSACYSVFLQPNSTRFTIPQQSYTSAETLHSVSVLENMTFVSFLPSKSHIMHLIDAECWRQGSLGNVILRLPAPLIKWKAKEQVVKNASTQTKDPHHLTSLKVSLPDVWTPTSSSASPTWLSMPQSHSICGSSGHASCLMLFSLLRGPSLSAIGLTPFPSSFKYLLTNILLVEAALTTLSDWMHFARTFSSPYTHLLYSSVYLSVLLLEAGTSRS